MNRGLGLVRTFYLPAWLNRIQIMGIIWLIPEEFCLLYPVILWLSVTLGLIFTKTDGGMALYPGGKYGFILSNWLSSLIGVAGVVLLILVTALTMTVIRFEGAYRWMKNLFRKRERPDPVVLPDEKVTEKFTEESISKSSTTMIP
jgi:S-DNA-T family DNA segregation ATPase FtsK/SpoIIIE